MIVFKRRRSTQMKTARYRGRVELQKLSRTSQAYVISAQNKIIRRRTQIYS